MYCLDKKLIHNPTTETQAKYKHYKELINKTARTEKILVERKALAKLEKDQK